MSTARFRIRNLTTAGAWSDFDDAGFDAAEGDELELQLEASPALDIYMTQFLCTDRSADRTAPVFDPVTGIAATPTTGVSMTLPAGEVGTWAIECQTNGGGDGTEDSAADNRKTRYVAVRTAALDLRHPLAGETSQYIGAGGWAVAIQELEDALDAFAAGAGSYVAGAGLTESPAGTFNVVANADGSIVVAANDVRVGILATDAQHGNRGGGALHANAIAAGAAGFMTGADKTKLDGIEALADVTDFGNVSAALAAASGAIAVNGQKITGLADGSASTDAAAFGQIAAALTAYVASTRTLTAGAGLTGGGDLSANRTFDVVAGDASITVNADSIEASGAFVAKNITTTGTLTAGAAAVTHTLTGILDQRYDGLTTTKTVARRNRQTTASDAVNTVRFAPSDDWEGHARSGGADTTIRVRFTVEPTISPGVTARWDRDVGTGTYSDMFLWMSASPLQGLSGLYVNRVGINSTSGGVYWDSDASALSLGPDGGIQISGFATAGATKLMSRRTSGDRILSWVVLGGLTSSDIVHAFGYGAATFSNKVSEIRGDGVYQGPSKHFQALVTAASLDAKVCTSYEIDATTCVTVHLDQALAAHDGYEIEIINLGTSTNVVTFDVTGGGLSTTIIDAGVGASTKTASGAGFVMRFKCLGGDGWQVTSRYLC